MKKYILAVSILISMGSCTTIKNNITEGCDWRISFFNTGINMDGNAYINLYSTGQRDLKWVFCKQDYPPSATFNCNSATQTLVAGTSFSSSQIFNGSPISISLPAPFPDSKWVIGDDGQQVHSVPYYHIFNTTICLNQSEVSNAKDFNLSVQSADAPLEKIFFNNTLVWNYTTGPRVFNIPNLLINMSNLINGLNSLRVVTIKTDLTRDNDFSDDNLIQSQYSAINVVGYLRVLKCCK
jgi:hypothetical protein